MAKKLDFCKRWLATAMAFLVWLVAGSLLQLVLLPYIHKTDLASHLKVRNFVSKIWRLFIRYLTFIGIIEISYQGFERLGRKGQLVVANHPSLIDVVLILSQVPSLNCIVKKDLLNNISMRNQILSCGYLPNTESVEILEQCHQVLQNEGILLFPEGTRTGWDSMVRCNRGAVSIGLRSAKVITPLVVKMSPLSLKKYYPWYKIPAEKIKYELSVGEDIDPQEWLVNQSIPMASRRLTKYLDDYFNSQTNVNFHNSSSNSTSA